MNKTININLAGIFFHIDEDAYARLQHYLDAIKKSFTDADGRHEIIQDIEARIAELFTERRKHERQVISLIEVEQVIEIMGQPEDYVLDDEFFEDEPKETPYTSTRTKKLYRDVDNSYIGGVSSGFGHYFGIDATWVRLIFGLLAIFSSGGFVLLYIGFWIFMPPAITTAEKLEMRGEPVNIDNIQRKVRESFESMAGSVKDADYTKYSKSFKDGSSSLAEGLGNVVSVLLTIFIKLIGILLIMIGGVTVIGLFIGFFTAGTLGMAYGGLGDFFGMLNATQVPVWVISLLTFLALAIPFFALFYLGLKILVNNLKRMPWAVKILLIVSWFGSVIALGVIGTRQAMDFSSQGSITQTEPLNIQRTDTLRVQFDSVNEQATTREMFGDESLSSYRDISFQVQTSNDSTYRLALIKTARGLNTTEAKNRAKIIPYTYNLNQGILTLSPGFSIPPGEKLRNQRMSVMLYIPENSTVYIDDTSRSYLSSTNNGLLNASLIEHYLTATNGRLNCLDCIEREQISTPTKQEDEKDEDMYSKSWDQQEEDEELYEFDKAVKSRRETIRQSDRQKDTLQVNIN